MCDFVSALMASVRICLSQHKFPVEINRISKYYIRTNCNVRFSLFSGIENATLALCQEYLYTMRYLFK